MSTIRIIAVCDCCESEEEFDSVEEFEASGWWVVAQGDLELIYCTRGCLVADLYAEDMPDAPPSFG